MKKIVCFLLLFCMLLSLIACDRNDCTDTDGPTLPSSSSNTSVNEKDVPPVVENKYLYNDGTSEYCILTADNPSNIVISAVGELNNFFGQATGYTFPVVSESEYQSNGKYISLGETCVSDAAGATVSVEGLGSQGFVVKTVSDQIIVRGGGDYGTLWGVYELLKILLNYKYYADDVYTLDRDVELVPLYELSVIDKPDIEYRIISDSQGYNDIEVAHRKRQIMPYAEFWMPVRESQYHNSFAFFRESQDDIVDSRFLANSGQQLCYTAHGNTDDWNEMVNIALAYLVKLVEENPTYNHVMFGIQDEYGCCTCDACKSAKAKYGTDSGAVIIFINELYRRLETYLSEHNIQRKIYLSYLAYFEFAIPPVKKDENGNYVPTSPDVVCEDGVGVMYAPTAMNYTKSIMDEYNALYYESLKQYSVITKSLFMWIYQTNFTNYLAPIDTHSYMSDLFKTMYENNVVYIFSQGQQRAGNSTGFDILRQYLVSEISWDTNADIAQLTNNFFEAYFGIAAEPMRDYYDELRSLLSYNHSVLNMPGNMYAVVDAERYWPLQTLNTWLTYIDDAYEAIAPLQISDSAVYTALHDRIMLESLAVRYLMLKLYLTSEPDIEEMREQFISDATSLGMTNMSEVALIADVFN